jgi:outer membrane receptor for monomeric catechols
MHTSRFGAIVILVISLCSSGFAAAGERAPHASTSVHGLAVTSHAPKLKPPARETLAADRDPYADPAAPYKANRLQSSPGVPILNVPGQTTVLTRQVLDDMNATSLSEALRSTAGVTVGR